MTQKNKLVIVVTVLAIAAVVWYSLSPKPKYGSSSIAFKKTGEVVQAYVPLDDYTSHLGLGGRSVLPEDYGMLWQFTNPTKPSFTMDGMRIPLDFLWMKDGKIVEVTSNVPIDRKSLQPTVDVTGMLEVNAGYAEKRGLQAGDEALIMGSSWTGN